MSEKEILKAINIYKSFDNLSVLENVSLSLKQGEFVSLIGPSGCGKTTLLKILAGLVNSSAGEVSCVLDHATKLPCAAVFQDSALLPWLNILDNIKLCINFGPLTNKEKSQLALSYLARVNLTGFEKYFPIELSGGMIQRVSVARAFAASSEIILMDEPFVHLDFLQRSALQKMTLDILRDEFKTVLFITHNMHEAVTLADRVLVMSSRPGKIIAEFKVDISRPRDIDKIREQKEYLTLVRDMTEILAEENKKSQIEFEQWIKEKRPTL
jgi:NitT/TauT family transport system ATP-binding protein